MYLNQKPIYKCLMSFQACISPLCSGLASAVELHIVSNSRLWTSLCIPRIRYHHCQKQIVPEFNFVPNAPLWYIGVWWPSSKKGDFVLLHWLLPGSSSLRRIWFPRLLARAAAPSRGSGERKGALLPSVSAWQTVATPWSLPRSCSSIWSDWHGNWSGDADPTKSFLKYVP